MKLRLKTLVVVGQKVVRKEDLLARVARMDDVAGVDLAGEHLGHLRHHVVQIQQPGLHGLRLVSEIVRLPALPEHIAGARQLKAGERTIRELVIFNDEEITDERIAERTKEVLRQIEAVRKARAGYEKLFEKLAGTPKKDKRKYRRARWKALRARIAVSQDIRAIEFTESVKRRLIEDIKESVERVQRLQREVDNFDRVLNPKNKKNRLKEAEQKLAATKQREIDQDPQTQQSPIVLAACAPGATYRNFRPALRIACSGNQRTARDKADVEDQDQIDKEQTTNQNANSRKCSLIGLGEIWKLTRRGRQVGILI